jgi:hypothetical protein
MPLITIASVIIPNWQGNTSGIALRIYANAPFTAQTGTLYPIGLPNNAASLGTFFQSIACTVASGSLTIPAVTLDSTTDSPDNPATSYSALLFDGASGKVIEPFGTFAAFALPATPASTTWAQIFLAEATE